MAPSERDSPAPRPRRRSYSPVDERARDDRRRHSGRDKERSRRPSSPLHSDDEPRRKRHEYTRDPSRDRRRRREGRDDSRDRKDRRRRDDYDSDRRRDRDRDDRRSSRRHRRRDSPSRSRSPSRPRRDRKPSSDPRSRSPPPPAASRKSRGPLASQEASFRNGDPSSSSSTAAPLLDADGKPIEKQKPNFNSTGLLAKEANTVAGTSTVLKYHEPPESRKPPPKDQWRIYVFKGPETLDTIHLFSRSCWLIGRDASICDYAVAHPSTSKQHAVIQFRYISKLDEFGEREGRVKPYIIDLESANGTRLNGKKVAASTYVELLDGDVLAFGESEREYVLMLPPP